MCTLALYFRVFPDYPLVVAANRDEALARPSAAPMQLWSSPWIYGGQDLLAGGTWLGVNEHGVTVGVLNRQSLAPADPHYRSRGHLCLDALKYDSANTALHAILEQEDHSYNPFNLVLADGSSAYVVNNQNGPNGPFTVAPLMPGFHIVTNRDPNDHACSRIARFTFRFAELARSFTRQQTPLSDLFASLHHQMATHAEPTKEARDGLCLHLDGYGTCSSTLLAYSRPERRYTYHFASGPPCLTHYKEVTLPSATFANHPPSTI
jgi:uncharacterized protein with NRDE domain